MASPKSKLVVSVHQIDAYNPREDRHYINNERQWYGIFDGHGGNICSEYIHKRIPEKLIELVDAEKKPIEDALPAAYTAIDREFLHKYSHLKGIAIGSCGLFAAIQEGTIFLANVGDSLAIVGRKDAAGVVHPLMINNEHNTKNPKEVALLRARTSDPNPVRGAPSTNVAGNRVGGVISVTRAFGDGVFKNTKMSMPIFEKHLPYLTCDPELTVHKILPEDEFLIIASDGLFEQVTHDEVVGWIQAYMAEGKSREKAAEFVITRLYIVLALLAEMTISELKAMQNKKRLIDDTTVIIVFFDK